LSKIDDAIDRSVFVPLMKDDPVVESKLAPKGSGRGLSALIPTGMRAYSVRVPDVAMGVAGFVMPGNHVDVLLSIGEIGNSNETGGGSTTTLLQNVEILAVDQKMEAPADNKVDTKDLRTVTLLVTPQQANLLDLAQNKGILHLALRNREDKLAAQTQPATLLNLRFRQEKPWDERFKGVIDALGKALAQRPPAPAPVAAAPKAPPKPRTVEIRTIRGRSEGAVIIQYPDTSTSRPAQQSSTALDARN
jgi:pilus assembly protein CpaB